MAKIEFYLGDAEKHLAVLDDSCVPRAGEFINIRQITYQVVKVTWAVDHADDFAHRSLRANITLEMPS